MNVIQQQRLMRDIDMMRGTADSLTLFAEWMQNAGNRADTAGMQRHFEGVKTAMENLTAYYKSVREGMEGGK